MTKSPHMGNHEPEPNNRRRFWFLVLTRTGTALGVVLLLGIAGGAWWTWVFVHERLAPLIERNLSQLLERPVRLGQVERVWLSGLRFGPSSVPATATDPDRMAAQAVKVEFQPLPLLLTRTLHLDVTLVQPDLYLQQDPDGVWIATQPKPQEPSGPITTQLNFIRVQNADLVLVPNPKAEGPKRPITLTQVNGMANFLDQTQRIRFEGAGQSTTGGNLKLKGETVRPTQETNLSIQGQNLLAADIDALVRLPIDLQAGRVDGNLNLQLRDEDPPLFQGTAALRGVTMRVPQVPEPFSQATGQLRFQGRQIGLEKVQTFYGQLPGLINGVVDLETGYNLAGIIPSATVAQVLETLNVEPPFDAAGTLQANLQLSGPLNQPILSGTATNTQPAQIDRVDFSKVSTRFELVTAQQTLTFSEIQGTPTVGGQVTGQGVVKLGPEGGLVLDLAARNVPGDAIAQIYGAAPENITLGTVSAQTEIFGPTGNLQTVVRWQAPEATYPGRGRIAIAQGVTEFRDTVLQVGGGTVTARGEVAEGRWQAQVTGSQVQLDRLVTAEQAQNPLVQQGIISGEFNLAGTTESFQLAAIQAQGQAQLNVADDTVNFRNVTLANGRWNTVAIASGVSLDRLLPAGQAPALQQGQLSGQFNLSGTTESFELATIQGAGQAQVNVAGGNINFSEVNLRAGRWSALANAAQVQLNRFSEQLRGQFSGQLNLAGTTASFRPGDIQATGQVRLSEGLALIDRPITAAVQWNGDRLRVLEATAPGFRADGVVLAQLEGAGAPQITSLDLNVQAQDLDLQELPFQTPEALQIAGIADFSGRLTGTPTAPSVVGDLRVNQLALNQVPFESVLTGSINFAPNRGLDLQLAGQQDQLQLALDARNRPESFFVQTGEAVARGDRQGENLLVSVQSFPLRVLNLTPGAAVGLGPVTGELSGTLNVNLDRLAVVGDVQVARPALGTIRGDQLLASFRYNDGAIQLTTGELRQGESRYALSGSLTPGENPRFQGEAQVTQGKVQDVLTALRWFEIEDITRGLEPPTYGTATSVQTVPVGLPNAPLQTQLRRLSEIEALLQQQVAQREAAPLPPLAELEGTFSGTVSLAGSLQTGANVGFDLQGQDWKWGEYSADQIIASGSFEDGALTLLPLRFQSGETLLAFTGQVGQQEQSGQLRVENLSVENLENFFPLPLDITGTLNATATLGGSLDNPQARGELTLANGTLNETPVETARGSFSYNDARLNFGSTVVISGPEPIQVIGSVPLELPFASAVPDNNQISVSLNVQNEGLALLNLLTPQVAWVNGEGQVNLQIEGTLDRPVATGTATVNNATFRAQALAEPLTNVTGTARFDFDRVLVEGVRGQFSQGQVVAEGVIPIFNGNGSAPLDNPLTVALENIELNLPGLYRGGVNGRVVLTGSVLDPALGGEIRLADGQVQLPDTAQAATAGNGQPGTAAPQAVAVRGGDSDPRAAVEFRDLALTLGDRVQIIRQPILNFLASGTLTLNGSLNDPRPRGTIELRRGQVNLFVTRFNLARGYEHTATFLPNQGLDPNLDVRLIASTAEVTRSRLPSTTFSSEVLDTPTQATSLGALQTVRIQARVLGPASQLFDNLELTSSPSRTRSEIVALIGGGFVDTLGRGDSTLAIANLAGSALLTNIQDAIGNAVGLSEFRLFPTTVISERSRTSTLGLGAEVGVDLTRNVSASVLKVLTADQPAQYNLRYRVNEQILMRGSTDFSGDSRAVVEYETRF